MCPERKKKQNKSSFNSSEVDPRTNKMFRVLYTRKKITIWMCQRKNVTMKNFYCFFFFPFYFGLLGMEKYQHCIE